ncbi:MAG TPA: ferredoxin reductase family protein [Burkholderiales bacterium]
MRAVGAAPAIGAVTVVTAVLVLLEIPRATWFSTAALSLVLGAAALVLMGAAAFLGSRWRVLESLFGGLDRVYRVHKWFAVWALVFAAVHFLFRAESEAWQTAAILPLPRSATRLVRQSSFVALGLIVLLALNRNIPYHRWRLWHKLSGPLFLIVALHWLSIRAPIALASPAGVWLAVVSVLGAAGAAYKLLLYPFLANHAEYRVVRVEPDASAVHLDLEPVGKPIAFTPGAFGFLRIKADGLREPHPFTLAARDRAGHVHFVIRALGDYTQKLGRELRPGMHAEIYAPYGRFHRRADAPREIWIAGGVGITPFIAWLADEAGGGFEKATLFYFFAPGREFPRASVIEDLARRRGARFVPVADGSESRVFREQFAALVRDDPAAVDVSFCGPKGLLEVVRAVLRENGVPERNLRHEHFEFR